MNDSPLVIMVNYGLSAQIERLLDGQALRDWRVMLVDNASEPSELRVIAERFGAQLVLLDRNYGFAGAVNRAVENVGRNEEILLLNPDVEVSRAQLRMLRTALAHSGLTAVSPLLVNTDGTVQVGTAGGELRARAFAFYFLLVSHLFRRARGVFFTRRQLEAGLDPAWLCMACLLLDGDAFRKYGPIPEDEIVYGEDLAWGYSAYRSGARFSVATDVRVVHRQGEAGASNRWHGALARLAVRVNGPVRGHVAVACMRLGLSIRRFSRRFIPGQRI